MDAVNSDIRIMSQLVKQFLPMAHLPRLDRLAGLDTRDQMLIDVGKNKRQMAAIARGKALDDADRSNLLLMDLRHDLQIASYVLEASRPDIVQDAKLKGKSRASAHAKIC